MPVLKLWMEQEIERLRKEVDDAYKRLHAELPALCLGKSQTYTPVVVHDSGERFTILMELPGLSPEDIKITVAPGKIVINAETGRKETGPHAFYRYTQRHLFCEIPLSKEVDPEGASATFRDECLWIDIPRKHSGIRRIAIETTDE